MERFFSHYTYIYPEIHLANHIVEFNNKRLVSYYPFQEQIASTAFISGLLICLPQEISLEEVKEELLKNEVYAGLLSRGSFLVRSFSV